MSRRFVVVLAVAALALLPGTAGAAEAQLLSVPYRSQLDGNPYQGADCGPTSLAMAMAAHGVVVPTRELRAQVNDLQGTWGVYDAGAAIANLALIAGRYGLVADGLQEGRGLHRWTLGELRDRLDAGQPVVAQVRYRALPGHGGSAYGGDHYVVLTGYEGDEFAYNDPVDPTGRGAPGRIRAAQLERAWRGDLPYAAFAVTRASPPPPTVEVSPFPAWAVS